MSKILCLFTSHYVSINSNTVIVSFIKSANLHPTMYLLILLPYSTQVCSTLNLHPTMYLLIRKSTSAFVGALPSFTSHYVSINSYQLLNYIFVLFLFTSHYVSINSDDGKKEAALIGNLHPTMYLLIPIDRETKKKLRENLHPTMDLLIPVIIKASLFLNSEALFCLPFKSANRLLILYALNMPEA